MPRELSYPRWAFSCADASATKTGSTLRVANLYVVGVESGAGTDGDNLTDAAPVFAMLGRNSLVRSETNRTAVTTKLTAPFCAG